MQDKYTNETVIIKDVFRLNVFIRSVIVTKFKEHEIQIIFGKHAVFQ